MATIYKLNVKTVSPFCTYPDEEVCKIIKDLIENYRHPDTRLGFESTEVSIEDYELPVKSYYKPKRHYNPLGQGYSAEPKKPKKAGLQIIQDGNGTLEEEFAKRDAIGI